MSTPPCPHELADPRMCPQCRRGLVVITPGQHAAAPDPAPVLQDVDGTLPGRLAAAGLARETAERLRQSTNPEGLIWAEALEWFSRRIRGGIAGVAAQRQFAAAFGDPAAPHKPVGGPR
ncbi:hypothetical protein ACFYOK_29565 [Microbispora bryophytorum]|uniref:hypothetical protein n=1 Tax=Microbispora bryophytorum TaxID=1460882 RepID=UPI0033E8ED71